MNKLFLYFLIIVFVFSQNASADLTVNLVDCWNFNNASGIFGVLGNNPSFDNSVFNSSGKVNGSYSYYAAHSKYTSFNSSLISSAPFAYSYWIKTDTTSVASILGTGTSGGWESVINRNDAGSTSSGRLGFGANSNYYKTTNFSINNGNWHYIITNVNSSNVEFTVDNTVIATLSLSSPSFSGSSLFFGRRATASDSYFTGQIDELCLWQNRTLSTGDKSILWNEGNGVSYPFGFLGVDMEEINLTSLQNGLVNFSIWYNFTSTNANNCILQTNEGNITTSNTSVTCVFSNIVLNQSNSITILPSYNTSEGVFSSATTNHGVRTVIDAYFYNSSLRSNFSQQNFLRRWNISSNISNTAYNINFSEDEAHEIIVINLTNSTTTQLNKTHSDAVINISNWNSPYEVFIIGSNYSLNHSVTYNNTLNHTLPSLNLSLYRSYCEGDVNFTNQSGSQLSVVVNASDIILPLLNVHQGIKNNYTFFCNSTVVSIVGRDQATSEDIGSALNYTFVESYISNFAINNTMNTTFSTTTYLPSWVDRTSFNSTLVSGSGENISHTISFDSLNNLLSIWFSQPNVTNYTFSLYYLVPDTSSNQSQQQSGGGGGGGTTQVTVVNYNGTFMVRPTSIERICVWVPVLKDLTFDTFGNTACRLSQDVFANDNIQKCEVSLPKNTQCVFQNITATFKTTFSDKTQFSALLNDSILLTSQAGQVQKVDYVVRVYVIPAWFVYGLLVLIVILAGSYVASKVFG